jgi:ribonuclease E
VIDFIDMEESRHQRQVEHKVKDSMRSDRARIQIGRISAFGLLEMSRQRLRPSLLEHSTEVCPHCAGTGRIRSLESAALHALRAIEEEGVRRRASEIAVSVPPNVALYLLNQKRHSLSEIEQRYGFTVIVEADEDLHAADCEIERVRSRREDHRSGERPAPELARASYEETSGDEVSADEAEGSEAREGDERDEERSSGEDGEGRPRSRRRRRRRRTSSSTSRREDGENPDQPQASGEAREVEAARTDEQPVNGNDEDEPEDNATDGDSEIARADDDGSEAEAEGDRPDGERNGEDRSGSRRRRGRRGGRRRRREPGEGETAQSDAESSETQTDSQGDELARNGHDNSEPTGSHEPPPSPPTPLESMPVEHTSMERAPYDPGPPVNVEAAPPPPQPAPEPEPVVASAPQPIAVPEPEPVPTPPPPPVPVIDAPPEKPKRGWWRR